MLMYANVGLNVNPSSEGCYGSREHPNPWQVVSSSLKMSSETYRDRLDLLAALWNICQDQPCPLLEWHHPISCPTSIIMLSCPETLGAQLLAAWSLATTRRGMRWLGFKNSVFYSVFLSTNSNQLRVRASTASSAFFPGLFVTRWELTNFS